MSFLAAMVLHSDLAVGVEIDLDTQASEARLVSGRGPSAFLRCRPVRPMKLLALGWVVSRRGGPEALARPSAHIEAARRRWSGGMSVSMSFHLALLGPSGAYWLDNPPDLSSKDATCRHAVDDPLLSCKQQALCLVGS
jgi:hypothetical protein